MTFTGFNLKFPEYEVITPQTKMSFNVRSLSVQEEERMKGSLMTPAKVTEHLNKCIYETVVKKPDTIKDYDSFLKSVTLKDRDALLYGLYHITYEEIRNYEVMCGSCRKEYPVTIKASSTFNFNSYPEKDNILNKRVKVDLPVSKGVSVIIKQPSLFDETFALRELSTTPGSNIDIIIEVLIIEKFEQDVEGQTKPVVYNDRQDIIDAYRSLPAGDKRLIHEKYMESFGKYAVELKMRSYCPSCGAEEVIDIDLVENFFRKLYSA